MATITELKGVGPVLAKACVDKGYRSVKDIATAVAAELETVPGIGHARAGMLIAAAKQVMASSAEPAMPKAADGKKKKAGRKPAFGKGAAKKGAPKKKSAKAEKSKKAKKVKKAKKPGKTEKKSGKAAKKKAAGKSGKKAAKKK